mmetsp:Transcript_6611/g.12078  ORF Transcript_6611/g.12078 Transcript_6611/m.12078 type:complete len:249 (-) Transcript_6611:1226-1972(-)
MGEHSLPSIVRQKNESERIMSLLKIPASTLYDYDRSNRYEYQAIEVTATNRADETSGNIQKLSHSSIYTKKKGNESMMLILVWVDASVSCTRKFVCWSGRPSSTLLPWLCRVLESKDVFTGRSLICMYLDTKYVISILSHKSPRGILWLRTVGIVPCSTPDFVTPNKVASFNLDLPPHPAKVQTIVIGTFLTINGGYLPRDSVIQSNFNASYFSTSTSVRETSNLKGFIDTVNNRNCCIMIWLSNDRV